MGVEMTEMGIGNDSRCLQNALEFAQHLVCFLVRQTAIYSSARRLIAFGLIVLLACLVGNDGFTHLFCCWLLCADSFTRLCGLRVLI